MKFGLFGGATAARVGPDVDSAQGYNEFIEYNIEAEALGYHSTFMVEHHFTGFGQVSASLNFLTWLGARTTTLRLGTAVLVLPWHNPVLVAEQTATLDLLSNGRLDFGIGKGYRYNEFDGFCIPMEEAEARFEESIHVIKKAWTSGDRFSHEGRYWRYNNIVVEPGVRQLPHPPIWMGAGSESSIRRVAELGANLLLDQFTPIEAIGEKFAFFKGEVEKLGRVFDPDTVAVARAFYVANNDADKEAAHERRLKAQRRLTTISQTPSGDNKASILSFSDTRQASEESALYGLPDEICVKIRRLEELGVRYLLLTGGGLRENLRRFAKDVMPVFRGGNGVSSSAASTAKAKAVAPTTGQ
jgi:alkanesulfonate monooxygenase SsuD/methylene tetrahydromethanopterin reductase-like flavin-dependent oxidoreductase (luciferase family)